MVHMESSSNIARQMFTLVTMVYNHEKVADIISSELQMAVKEL